MTNLKLSIHLDFIEICIPIYCIIENNYKNDHKVDRDKSQGVDFEKNEARLNNKAEYKNVLLNSNSFVHGSNHNIWDNEEYNDIVPSGQF